jgi:histidinol-phosphate/aromatic aminotransferase/cobyric acid decarboxylase-like protein
MGLTVVPSEANFVMMVCSADEQQAAISGRVAAQGVV